MLRAILKDNLSINDYVFKMKSLGIKLNAIGKSIYKRDIIMYVLNDLSSYFNPCICSLNNKGDEISMEVVYN